MKYLILENIRSAYNVGAMFRTADGAGVDKIFLVGYTPTPIDRFGREQSEILKTSLGASQTVAWEHFANILECIELLKKQSCSVVSVELNDSSIPLQEYFVPANVAYVLGNEVDGVSKECLAHSDTIVEIPMLGEKESLNVSVAAGIILYHELST